MKVANWRRQEDMNRDIAIAWYVAALSRQDKLPKLDTLLVQQTTTRRRQTPAEQREVLKVLSKRYGIPLQERKVH